MELRRALGPETGRISSPSPRTLQFTVENAWIDAIQFQAGANTTEATSLDAAAKLYTGPLLAQFTQSWVLEARDEFQRQYQTILRRLSAIAQTAGNLATASDYLRRAIEVDPYCELARRELMQVLSRAGEPQAAILVYQDFSRLLQRTLNTVPEAETTALFLTLRDEARRRMVEVKRVGVAHRQGAQPTVDAPAVRLPLRPGRIPTPLTRLVGREQDVQEIETRLRLFRLVAVIGTGGIGKTRISMHVASHMADEFVDGAYFVELASLSDGSAVVETVAGVLGVREEAGRDLVDSIITALSKRSLLLVMDNCEHVVDAAARLVERLLSECPSLRILSTSRQPFAVRGEAWWTLRPLAAPDPAKLPVRSTEQLAHVLLYPSVQLFLDRLAAQSRTSVGDAEAAALAHICHRLDGIPLAIELAAARASSLSLKQIADRLDDRFRLLTVGCATDLPRQQTLRGMIDWSYDLLDSHERTLFTRVSVFRGGFTLEAAEHICAKADCPSELVLDGLSGLVGKSMLFMENDTQGQARYSMLETLREYAASALQSDELQELQERHAGYFLGVAEQAEPELSLKRQRGVLSSQLHADIDNVRGAMDWCLSGGSAEMGLRIAAALSAFWYIRGHLNEGWTQIAEALSRTDEIDYTEVRATALRRAGRLAVLQSDFVSARRLYEEALAVYRQIDAKSGIAVATCHLGLVSAYEGNTEEAYRLFDHGEQMLESAADLPTLAHVMSCLGDMAWFQGYYELAEAVQVRSIAAARKLGDKSSIGYSLANLGSAAWAVGDYDASGRYLHESLRLLGEIDDEWGVGLVEWSLGNLYRMLGDFDEARRRGLAALIVGHNLDNSWGLAFALEALAFLSIAESDHHNGVFVLGATSALRKTIGSPMPLFQRQEFESAVKSARAGFSDFETVFQSGAESPLYEVIDLVLQEVHRPATTQRAIAHTIISRN